jgi:transposase
MVVVVGIDVHKGTHCAVAVDEAGRQLGTPVTVRATDAGHRQLLRWAAREFAEHPVQFAVEDCRHVSGRLERELLTAAAVVVRVPPKLMAQTRTSARTRGKSDPIDALAIARAAVREPDLPRAEHTHASRELKLLVDRREDLVARRTQAENRLRWHLHELDPEFEVPARGLALVKQQDRVQTRLETLPESLVGRLATEILTDIRRDTTMEALRALKRRLARIVFLLLRPTDHAAPACLPAAA